MKYLTYIFCFFIMTSQLHSEAKWRVLDTLLRDGVRWAQRYYAIDCFDSLNCCAAANMNWDWPWNRTTTDGGKTWFTTLKDTVKRRVQDVAYPSENLCVMVCEDGYIWKSFDQCQTWELERLNTNDPNDVGTLRRVDFFDDKTGGIAGLSQLFLTDDGGHSWTDISIPLPDSILYYYYNDIFIPSSKNIYTLVGYQLNSGAFNKINLFVKSTDKGKTWHFFETDTLDTYFLYFINEQEGWASGEHQRTKNKSDYLDVILHTEDGGETWEVQLDSASKTHQRGLREVYFADENNGVATGIWYKLWRTTNGGEDWVLDEEVDKNNDFFTDYFGDVHFFHHDYMFAVGYENHLIYKYSDEPVSVVDDLSSELKTELKIYPNPANTGEAINFELILFFGGKHSFEVYNSAGMLIDEFRAYLPPGKKTIQYEPDNKLSAGVYYLKICREGEKIETKPFVVLE